LKLYAYDEIHQIILSAAYVKAQLLLMIEYCFASRVLKTLSMAWK